MSRSRLEEFLLMHYLHHHNGHVYEYSKFFMQVLPNPVCVINTKAVA